MDYQLIYYTLPLMTMASLSLAAMVLAFLLVRDSLDLIDRMDARRYERSRERDVL